MEFVTDDPVASAVSYQRVTFGARVATHWPRSNPGQVLDVALDDEQPARAQDLRDVAEASTWRSWLGRLNRVLHTRSISEKGPASTVPVRSVPPRTHEERDIRRAHRAAQAKIR